MEKLGDFSLFQVDSREHNMAWWLIEKLYDPFAQVGVHHFDPVLFQIGIQMAFFRQDGFAFDDSRAVLLLETVQTNPIVFFSVRCPMDFYPVFFGISLKILQIGTQIS